MYKFNTGMTRVLLSHGADFTFARAHVRSHPPRPAHRGVAESREGGAPSVHGKCWVCVAPRSSVTQKPEFSYRTRVGRARTFQPPQSGLKEAFCGICRGALPVSVRLIWPRLRQCRSKSAARLLLPRSPACATRLPG